MQPLDGNTLVKTIKSNEIRWNSMTLMLKLLRQTFKWKRWCLMNERVRFGSAYDLTRNPNMIFASTTPYLYECNLSDHRHGCDGKWKIIISNM